jgi:hypothetical protein
MRFLAVVRGRKLAAVRVRKAAALKLNNCFIPNLISFVLTRETAVLQIVKLNGCFSYNLLYTSVLPVPANKNSYQNIIALGKPWVSQHSLDQIIKLSLLVIFLF